MKKKIIILISILSSLLFFFNLTSKAWYLDIGSINISYLDSNLNPIYYYDLESNEYKNNKFEFGKNGTSYKIESPTIEGFIPNLEYVEGIFDGDKSINIIYEKENKKCNLIINFIDENLNIIKTSTYQYNYNDYYEIIFENIIGYEFEEKSISGQIFEDKTININLKTLKYKLIIHYVDDCNNKLFDDYIEYLKYDEEYNIKSPILKGYKIDKEYVNGNLTKDTEIYVRYILNYYKLIIHHIDANGKKVFNDSIYNLKANTDYYILINNSLINRIYLISINEDTEINIIYKQILIYNSFYKLKLYNTCYRFIY